MPRLLPCAAVLFACLGSAGADVVTTKSGLAVEGRVARERDGTVVVTTAGGDVRLSPAEVAAVTEGDGPAAVAAKARSALGKDDVVGRFRLALALDAQGRPDLARAEYEGILAVDPDHPAARRALGFEKAAEGWLPVAVARRRQGLVLYAGTWMLPAEVDRLGRGKKTVTLSDLSLAAAMTAAATSPALAEAATARIARASGPERVEAARTLLVHRDPAVRRWCCGALAKEADESALRTLLAVAVRDGHPSVRDTAVRAAATFGHDDVAIPLVRALGSDRPVVVAHAARALAILGDRRALPYVIKRIVSHGASPQAYFAHEVQTAYIRDFDVEVAQTSFIADPIIGTIQEGTAQDVKVLDVTIEQTIVEGVLLDTFRALARSRARNASEVRAWAKANAASIPDFSPVASAGRTPPTEGAGVSDEAPPPADRDGSPEPKKDAGRAGGAG